MKKYNFIVLFLIALYLTGCVENTSPDDSGGNLVDERLFFVADAEEKISMSTNWAEHVEFVSPHGHSASVAENKDYIFFVSEGKLIRYDKDNGTLFDIVVDFAVGRFYLTEESIFFLVEGEKIYRTDFYGESTVLIIDSVKAMENSDIFFLGFIIDFFVHSNVLYFQSDGISLLKYDMEHGTLASFCQDVSSYAMLNDYFYCISHATRDWSLYKRNIYTGNSELLRGDGLTLDYSDPIPEYMVDQVTVLGEDIYYSTKVPGRIFRYNQHCEDLLIVDFAEDWGGGYFFLHTSTTKLYFTGYGEFAGSLFEYEPLTNNTYLLKIPDEIHSLRIAVINDVLFYYSQSDLEKLMYVELNGIDKILMSVHR
jgi:hypothetical protein